MITQPPSQDASELRLEAEKEICFILVSWQSLSMITLSFRTSISRSSTQAGKKKNAWVLNDRYTSFYWHAVITRGLISARHHTSHIIRTLILILLKMNNCAQWCAIGYSHHISSFIAEHRYGGHVNENRAEIELSFFFFSKGRDTFWEYSVWYWKYTLKNNLTFFSEGFFGCLSLEKSFYNRVFPYQKGFQVEPFRKLRTLNWTLKEPLKNPNS